jgi:hypothetical protein
MTADRGGGGQERLLELGKEPPAGEGGRCLGGEGGSERGYREGTVPCQNSRMACDLRLA